jgi:energy-coupling factor transporter ATP-binding protein EcfA2
MEIMNILSKELIGLRPYKKEESDSFYGRDKEVERLLQILQKDKLVTLIGSSGSGKTSLINAGLIPRLEKGFLGQAGKQWAICSFRPGISPFENFAYSLTSKGSLTHEGKANTEDFGIYLKSLKDLGSLGLIEIYNKSEINNKKNLLVVIDQLEDLFTFNRLFDSNKSELDDLLFNIVARTTKIRDTAIYFALVIQSEYFSNLSHYTKLQEIISKSQYAIPNLTQSAISEIIKNTFLNQGVGFANDSFESIVEPLITDATLLPNFQFLIKQLILRKTSENINENNQVNIDDVEALGGLNNCIQKSFEETYQNLTHTQKVNFEKINKALYGFEITNDGKYETIEKISSVSGLTRQSISELIYRFKETLEESYDIVPRTITGVNKNQTYSLDPDDILSNKYFLQRNWKQEKKWLKEEEESFKSLKYFAELTENFNSGKASLLFTPELELAQEWIENKYHNANWARKYSFNYQNTIDYIDKSITYHKQNREREENRLKRKKKTTRVVVSVMSLLVIVAFSLFINSTFAEKRALESKEKADISARLANEERKKASSAKEKAEILRIEAEMARENAEREKTLALEAKKRAEVERARALIANKKAYEQTKIANKQKEIAEIEREIAQSERKNAEFAREESENRRKIAEIESEFYPLVRKMERLIEYANNTDQGYKMQVNLSIQDALSKLEEYQYIQEGIYGKSEETEGTYVILQTALRVLEGKNDYNETSMMLYKLMPNAAIRSIDAYNESVLAFGGDNGVLYIVNAHNLRKFEIQIEERIRKIKFEDPNNILVGTFEGNIYRVDLSKSFTKDSESKLWAANQPIIDIKADLIKGELIILSENKVTFLNLVNQSANGRIVSFEIVGVESLNNQLFIASNKEIFFYNGQSMVALPLEFDLLKNEEILTFSFSDEFLFIGTQSGKIFTFLHSSSIDGRKPFKHLGTIVLHRSGITKLYFDEPTNTLYSSSFDNQILKYKIEESNFDQAVRDFVSLIGHEKWVWDMSLIKNAEGEELIVTVDENGNVLTWYKNQTDLATKVKNLLTKHKQTLE